MLTSSKRIPTPKIATVTSSCTCSTPTADEYENNHIKKKEQTHFDDDSNTLSAQSLPHHSPPFHFPTISVQSDTSPGTVRPSTANKSRIPNPRTPEIRTIIAKVTVTWCILQTQQHSISRYDGNVMLNTYLNS